MVWSLGLKVWLSNKIILIRNLTRLLLQKIKGICFYKIYSPLCNLHMIKCIAIVGPESTGKSELAAALASHYKTLWVPEYARAYLNSLSHEYNYNDLLAIAKMQMQNEDFFSEKIYEEWKKLQTTNPKPQTMFCDTNLTVIKIWSEFKYGKCDDWITNEIKSRKYFLHLLTDIDLPWQPDPLREHPNERKELFEIYLNELKNQQVDFEIVSGIGDLRIENAIRIIEGRL
jgi:nicotinamide riboside kinase